MAVEKKTIFFPEQEELFKERTGKEFSFFTKSIIQNYFITHLKCVSRQD